MKLNRNAVSAPGYRIKLYKYTRKGGDEETIVIVPFVPPVEEDVKEAQDERDKQRTGGDVGAVLA
jgi:hypothetical protein